MKLSDFEPDYVERMRKRFWAKVDKRGPDDCWEWTAGTKSNGYGSFSGYINGSQKHIVAHRAAILLTAGRIDDSLDACHTCDNRTCVNPNHIFLGTRGDNNRDRARKGRSATEKPNVKGEKHHKAKLTRQEVRKIRKTFNSRDITKAALARKYGVTSSTIRRIVDGTGWTHI